MDIDQAALELATSDNLDNMFKALPPKLAYRFRRWAQQHQRHPKVAPKRIAQVLAQKIEEAQALQSLAKNEVMTSVYDNGLVKLDFGAAVPEAIKKAAMAWAKRKGLKPIEASLNKSQNSPESLVLSTGDVDSLECQCVKRSRWAA